MAIYFLRFDSGLFHQEIWPTLAACWSRRSFEPCRALARKLLDSAGTFEQTCFLGPDEPLLRRVADGLRFDRDFWRLVVGEVLLIAATDVPKVETAPEVLTCLLAPEYYQMSWMPRERFAPIQQVLFGTHDLRFGSAIYRCDRAGINNAPDVVRLAAFLDAIDPTTWQLASLAELREPTDEAERAEELEFAREWFPPLRQLYRDAARSGGLIVCETL